MKAPPRVVVEQAVESGGGPTAGSTDAGRAHEDHPVDPVGGVQGEPQRAGTAEGIADEVGLVQAESVEQSTDPVGDLAEGIGTVDALAGASVAGQVGHDDPVLLRQRGDVPGVVGDAGGAGASTVQQHEGRSFAGLRHEDLLSGDVEQ